MRFLLFSILWIISAGLFGQDAFKEQFTSYSVVDKKLGKVEFCTFNSTIMEKKPLLIFIHGSGNLPTFHVLPNQNSYNWCAFTELKNYKDKYHVIFVNKPDVALFDTVQSVNGIISYPMSNVFREKYSLEWRAEAASKIIDMACLLLPVDKSKVLVVGHSQGGQVAPKVALINKKVTHVALLNTNALSHLYDFVMQERLAAFTGDQSFEEAQLNVDSLFIDYSKIFANPQDKTSLWNDETYFRWASFSDETPLENMLKLKIPIYVVAGGKDLWGSFIMNTDYVKIEFLRYRKNNLTYKVYPNANHFLQNEIMVEGNTTYVDIKPMIFSNIDDWTNQ